MGVLRDAVDAKATANQRACFAALDWCRVNPGWKPICDIPSDEFEDSFYLRWDELSSAERSSWVRNYGAEDAEAVWERFGRSKTCRCPVGYISEKGEFFTRAQFHAMD